MYASSSAVSSKKSAAEPTRYPFSSSSFRFFLFHGYLSINLSSINKSGIKSPP